MIQEHKELLIKDLCARLPYGVIIEHEGNLSRIDTIFMCDSISISSTSIDKKLSYNLDLDELKPYLFPLSSMTEEQWDTAPKVNLTNFTFESLKCGCFTLASYTCENNLQDLLEFINWLYVNHFDVNGLIPNGLANDATGLNIY